MKKIITITSFLLLITSCDDFTDVGLPTDQVTRDLVFKDDALANSAMAGVYRSIESSGFLSGGSAGASVYLNCYADDMISHAVATADTSVFYLLTHNASSTRVYTLWTAAYKQIYQVNSMIEGLENPSSSITESVREKLLGESLFIRAILHLYLVKTFGAIPYVTTTNYEVNQHVKRQSEEEVYQLANSDLLEALEKLPATYAKGVRVRPSKVTARALLARVAYEQGHWSDALTYTSAVINDTQYQMETNLEQTFLKNSSSAIWQLMPYDTTYNALEGNYYILRTAPPTTISLSADFMAGFEANDTRRTKWIGEIKDNTQKSYFYPYKYKQQTNSASTLEYSVIMRVEEMYLIRAEAQIETGQIALGLQDINKIRNRAGLGNISVTDIEFLRGILLKERRYEFFAEWGQRFYDLKHFDKLDQTLGAIKTAWKNDYRYWPIPEKELLINPNLNPQNNGY